MILFDTETTGLPIPLAAPVAKQPFIIDICAIRLNDKTLVEEACYNELVNTPGRPPISAEITKITGITEEMLKGKLPFASHVNSLVGLWIGERHSVAHNHDFDATLLTFELTRLGLLTRFPWAPNRICTVEANYYLQNKRLKMGDLFKIATGRDLAGAHRAINDVRGLAEIVRWMRKHKKI